MQEGQLNRSPLFLILLPVYYLIHLLVDYRGLFSFSDLFHFSALLYLGIPFLLFIICTLTFNFSKKIAIPIFAAEVFFFFFSIVKDIAKFIHPFLTKYSVLLPILLVILIGITIYMMRTRRTFQQLALYLNLLFIILLAVDVFILLSDPRSANNKNVSKQNFDIRKKLKACVDCEKPDIYFIIFDGHSGSGVLKKLFNYDNSKLDDSLKQKGFFVAKKSVSNYNSTAFSVAATLQMDYHKNGVPEQVETLDFLRAQQLINYNPLCYFLQTEGYKIVNYSIFPLLEKKSVTPAFKLADAESILESQTFWYNFKNDIAWNFKKFTGTGLSKREEFSKEDQSIDDILRIQQTIEGIKKTSAESGLKPVFVYGHILLPHAPYFFDSIGNKMTSTYWLSNQNDRNKYLQQIIYTRKIIEDLATTLQKEAKRPRIIIIQGDHGYQFYPEFGKESELNKYSFSNLNAIYFPGNDYSLLYDSISSVNTFRVVLKQYFKQDIQLIKDSSYFSTTK